jgi:hypothetical protein
LKLEKRLSDSWRNFAWRYKKCRCKKKDGKNTLAVLF